MRTPIRCRPSRSMGTPGMMGRKTPAMPTRTQTVPAISINTAFAFSLTLERRQKPVRGFNGKEKRPPIPAALRFLDCSFGNSLARAPRLLLLLCRSGLLRGLLDCLLRCVLHLSNSPLHQVLRLSCEKAQCDPYIRFFGANVKRKMQGTCEQTSNIPSSACSRNIKASPCLRTHRSSEPIFMRV